VEDEVQEGLIPVTKHIFVTGGVVSSLGKGLTAASLGISSPVVVCGL